MLRRWFLPALLGSLACTALSKPLAAQPAGMLTPSDIAAAIELGMKGEPTPYLLHYDRSAAKYNPPIVAAVYTPFLRVAFAANASRKAGRRFTPNDVPHSLLEPIAYVAFRWYCCDVDRATNFVGFDSATTFPYKIAVPGDRLLGAPARPWMTTARPLWVTRDMAALASFGAEVPYPDVVLIAAYPLSALSDKYVFVSYREWPSPRDSRKNDYELRVGRVTRDDLVSWR